MLKLIKNNIALLFVVLFFGATTLSASKVVHDQYHIIVLGDSLTKGHGVAIEDAFPTVLENMFREKGIPVRVMNEGVSGATTSGGLVRLQAAVNELDVPPDMIIIALGANDGLRARPVEKMRSNLEGMIQYAKEQNARVVLAGMRLPYSYDKSYRARFEAVFPDLAQEHDLVLIPFLLEGVAGHRSLNLPDHIHPNEEGHKILARTVFHYIEPLFPH